MLFRSVSQSRYCPTIMADFNDALEGGCKFALLQFDDDGDVAWDFLADVRVCDDPDCTIDHTSETGMSHDTFNTLKENS